MIRLATLSDLEAMIRLERRCVGAGHWSYEQYRQLFESDAGGLRRLVLVIEGAADSDSSVENAGDFLLGFLIARPIPPEWELENIAVEPSMRRVGAGVKLLAALLAEAQRTNSESVLLEVRESNHAARAFYERSEFRVTGRRKAYYAEPSEDAILYRLEVKRFSQ